MFVTSGASSLSFMVVAFSVLFEESLPAPLTVFLIERYFLAYVVVCLCCVADPQLALPPASGTFSRAFLI